MPPAKKINKSVILFDLSMDRTSSLLILKNITTHLLVSKPNDLMRLVYLNSIDSTNSFDYKHIKAFPGKGELYNPAKLISGIEKETKGMLAADWLEGLEVSATLFNDDENDKNIFTYQLFFITDLVGLNLNQTKSKLDAQIDKVVDIMNLNDVHLYIIGNEAVTSPVMIRTKDDVIEYMKLCCISDNENCQIAKRLCIKVGGIICNMETSLDFITFYTNPIPKQAWSVPLTLGDFQFPTLTSRIINTSNISPKPLKAKKYDEWFTMPPKTEMEEVKDIHKEDTVYAYTFLGKQFVLPEDVKETFRYSGERTFTCIGFVDQSEIPELYLCGLEVHLVTGQPGHAKLEAFYSLVEACERKKMYGLAYRCYNKNNSPKLYILIPQLPGQFLMVLHPEKVKHVVYPSTQTPKQMPDSVDPLMGNAFDDYLLKLSETQLTLHPSATNHIHYKNAINKIGDMILEQHKPTKQETWDDSDVTVDKDGNPCFKDNLEDSDVTMDADGNPCVKEPPSPFIFASKPFNEDINNALQQIQTHIDANIDN